MNYATHYIKAYDYAMGYNDKLVSVMQAAAEFSADMIKTVFVEKVEQVAGTAGIPVFTLGGAKTNKPIDYFSAAANAVRKGAAGVVKHGMDPAEAAKKYGG